LTDSPILQQKSMTLIMPTITTKVKNRSKMKAFIPN